MIKGNREIIKSSVFVSLITAVGLIIGFFSQVLIAYYFGTSRELDRFFVAYAFPAIFSGMAGAVFSSCLIPVVTPIKNEPEALKKAVSMAFFFALAVSSCMALFGFLGREFILKATTNLSRQDLEKTVTLGGLVWMIVGITILTSFISSVYQLTKSFCLPAVMFLLPTTGRILGTVIFANKLGIMALILGEMVFSILSLLIMLPIIFKYVSFPFRIEFGNIYTIHFIKAIIPVGISLVPFTILPSIDVFWASRLAAGSISYIGYSTRIVVALGCLVINGVYMVILPYLSEDISNNKKDEFISRLSASIQAVLIIFIPIAIFCSFFRYDFISVLFKRGEFTEESVKSVGLLLPLYLFGLVGMGPTTLISRAYCAKKQFAKFGIISIVFIVIYFVLAGILSHYFSYIGIGFAYLIYWFSLFAVSTLFLESKILSSFFFTNLLKVSLYAIVSVTLSYFIVIRLLSGCVFVGLIVGFVGAGLTFTAMCYFFKVPQVVSLTKYAYDLSFRRIIYALRCIRES
ncbi:MAG: hypothetical protein JW749_12775 [Sedimentisphaerales bacterium]|nr:hypothetical protein [Sedimentisphaerales bacterium]